MIKLDQLDPDWDSATKHGQASMIGYPAQPYEDNMAVPLCPCCLQVVQKTPIPVCVNSKELEILGFGFPLFYSFLKNCMILLIILICSYNAISLKKSIDGNYNFCHPDPHHTASTNGARLLASQLKCTSWMIDYSRIDNQVNQEQEILRVASFMIQLLFLVYMRDHLTKLQSYYDERNTSFADYAVMLKNIPKQKGIQAKLKNFFGKYFKSPHEVQQITLIPEYPEIDQLQAERANIINQLRKSYDKDEFTQQDVKNQQFLDKIDLAIDDEVARCRQNVENDEILCTKAILVFNTDSQKCEVLQEFGYVDNAIKVDVFGQLAQEITIKQAPEPKEILWKNVQADKEQKFILYVTSWGLSLLLLIIITVIFYFILEQKSQNLLHAIEELGLHPESQEFQQMYNGAVALVFVMIFLVILFNKIVMSTLFYKFTEMEKHETRSKLQLSFGIKYLLGLFFTTALMTLAVEAIRFDNYYAHPYGVIQQETVMFILNAVFVPFFWIVNPFGIVKYIKRKINYGKRSMTQQQANLLMEPTHYDLGKRYAEIIEIMWFTFLYTTLIPLSAFFSLGGFILYYWVDKYTLLRKSSLQGQISGKFVLTGMKLLDLTLMLRPAGEIIFDVQLRHGSGLISSIIMVSIGCLYFILPVDKIINKLNPQMFKLEEKTYQQVKETFKHTYHTEHPIYKLIHSQKISQKGPMINFKPSPRKPSALGSINKRQITSQNLTQSITYSMKRLKEKKQEISEEGRINQVNT